MISDRTKKIFLTSISVGSNLNLLPFHWDERQQRLVPSTPRFQLIWKIVMLANLAAKCFLITMIVANVLVLSPDMPMMEKISGICLGSYLLLYVAANTAMLMNAQFIRVILNAHFHLKASRGKVWHTDPTTKDDLEWLFLCICGSALFFVVAGYPSTFFLYETNPNMLSVFQCKYVIIKLIPAVILLFGYWLDALFLSVLLMFVVIHYYCTLRWLQRISWTTDSKHKRTGRVQLFYHSLQILHQYYTEQTRLIFPSNVTLITAMLNGFLYRLIAYYHTIPELYLISPVILFLLMFYTFVLKKYADGANAVMLASREVGTVLARSYPGRARKLEQRIFRSFRPIRSDFLGFFTLSKSTFMLSLRFAVVDSVIFLLLTFRNTVERNIEFYILD